MKNNKLIFKSGGLFRGLCAVLLMIGLWATTANAQYTLSSCGSPGTMTSTGTLAVSGDDAMSGAIPIGFSFNYFGTSYTSIFVSTNGFVTFNAGQSNGCCSGYVIPGQTFTYIALFHDDLYAPSATPGTNNSIYYNTLGSAPNRIFVVRYQGVGFCCSSTPTVDGEIQLYEGSNQIRLVTNFANGVSPGTMGISLGNSTTGFVVSGRNSNSWTAGSECWSFMPSTGIINNDCANALPITCGQTVTGTTVGATLDGPASSCTGGSVAADVWYTMTNATNQSVTLSMCGSSYDSKLDVYTGACGALTNIGGCNDDFCGLQSQMTFTASAGTTYRIRVHGFGGATGAFTLSAACTPVLPPNDNCTGALPIACGGTVTGNTTGATPDANTCGGAASPGLWYSVTPAAAANITASLCGSGYDTRISVYSGPCASLTMLACNDDFCGLQSQVTFPAVGGTTYFILVNAFTTSSGPFTLAVTCAAACPPPVNDQCTSIPLTPITVGVPTTFTGNTVCVTSTNDGAFAGYPTVWHRISLPSCATIELNYCSTSPAFGNVWINLGTGTACPVNTFTPAGTFVGCGNGNFIVTHPNMPAGDYWIPVIGQGNDPGFIVTPGPYTLTVNTTACPPPATNISCATSAPIACLGSGSGSSIGVPPSTMPGCDGNPGNNTGLWYVFNTSNPGGGVVTATTCNAATNYDSYLKLFSGSCGSLTCIAQNDDDGSCAFGGLKSTITWTASQGVNYYIFVTGFVNSTGFQQLDVSCVLCTNPATGGTASGPATAPCTNSQINLTLAGYSGAIQWQVSSNGGATWTDISGATSDNIFTSFSSLGTYLVRAKVSGGAGCGDSFSNTLTYNVVNSADALTATATPNPLCPGSALTLTSASSAAFSTEPGSGTLVSLGDDQVSGALPIGFSFNFYGVNYTDFYIGSNGFLTFSPGQGSGCCTGGFLPSNDAVNNVIAFAWEDLYPPLGGTIEYFTTGPIGSRKLVVNFIGINHYANTLYPVTSQVVLYETSNFIDINTTNMPSDGGNHTMGVEDASGTVALPVSGRNSQNWSVTNERQHFEPAVNPYGYTVTNVIAGTGFLSYAWTGPNSYSASGQNPPAINNMVPAGFGTYQVTGTAANGCLANAFVTVTALPSPVADAQSNTPVCDGTTLQLFGDNFAVGQGSGNSYSWTGPNGYGPVAGQNPTLNPTVAGSGDYIVTVTNSNGCTATTSTNVLVNPNPTLAATVTNAICVGDMNGCIDIDASLATAPYLYDYNGNQTTDGVYCGLGAGTYTVTVSDDNNCLSTIQATVIEEDLVAPTISCPPTVTVNSNPGVCYATGVALGTPVFGDNCAGATVSNNTTPTFQYPVGGTFVQWEVSDLSQNKTSCNQLVIVQDLEAPVALCKNICVYLNSGGTATITGADINNGSTDNCSVASLTVSPNSFSYANAGSNVVTLTVTDINGNSSTCTATVTIGEFYTIFGSTGNCTANPGGPAGCLVNISSGSTVNGNVGSYRLVQTGSTVTINGKVVSGGKVDFGSGTTSGSVSAANNYGQSTTIFSAGSGAQILGDIDVLGDININPSGSAVTGTVRHPAGTTYTGPVPGGGVLIAAPILPALPGMPVTHTYTCGGANITGTATLNPGSYGNLSPGGGSIITFQGPGNYYFSDINLSQGGGARTFRYNFMNLPGNINIYVCSNIHLGGSFATQWANPGTPDACRVYFEVQGSGITNIGSGSNFQGRMWAPYSGINVGGGSGSATITGSLWSAKKIDFSGAVTVNKCASPCPPGPRIGDEVSTTDDMSEMLQVYPNPTTGKATVKFFADAPYGYTLKVIDYLGRIVLSNESKAEAGDNTQEIDLGSFAKGLYLIEVGNAEHSQKVKVVVQ